jgi:hypothetical protein
MDDTEDTVIGNPTRSGRRPTVKAAIAGAIKSLTGKRPRKKKVVESSPSQESLTEVPVTYSLLCHLANPNQTRFHQQKRINHLQDLPPNLK